MKSISIFLLIVTSCCLCPIHGSGQTVDKVDQADALQNKVDELHRHIMTHFYHPRVNLIYDYIPPVQQGTRWEHLPTVEEIANEFPNPCGWHTGMEDCALNTGAYLATLVYKYEVTGLEDHAEDARKMFKGLLHLATVSSEKGFLPRAVLPDGVTYYPNSSVDQYTMFLFGMWVYYRSTIVTNEEKQSIAKVIKAIAERTVRDNYEILSSKGQIAQYCDIGAISTDRASRLLSLLMFANEVDPGGGWHMIYKEKLEEQFFQRLAVINNAESLSRYETYSILQNQVSIVQLVMQEQELPTKTAYLNALKVGADVVEPRVYQYIRYDADIHDDNYMLGNWRLGGEGRSSSMNKEYAAVRVPCEALVVMLLNFQAERALNAHKEQGLYAKGVTQLVTDVILSYDYSKMRYFGCLYAEMAYWIAVKENLLNYN